MTTKEEFTKRYNAVVKSVAGALKIALERAINNNALNLENMENNFSDVYPLIAAVLQKEINKCLEGGSYEETRRAQKRQAAKYRRDLRIWTNYAGDYTDKPQTTQADKCND